MLDKRRYTSAAWGQVHYRVAGHGQPLVLCHQSPLSLKQFDAAVPVLAAAGFCVLAVDTPGFGYSDAPNAVSIPELARAIPAVMDAENLASAAWAGHHTGALLVTEAACQWPERCDWLILNGALPLTDEERDHWRAFTANIGQDAPAADGSHLQRLWEFRKEASPGWDSLRIMHDRFVDGLRRTEQAAETFAAALDYDHAEAIGRTDRPALILTNTGDDIYEYTRRVAELRPDFAYTELEGGTHDIVDEQTAAWAGCIIDYAAHQAPR